MRPIAEAPPLCCNSPTCGPTWYPWSHLMYLVNTLIYDPLCSKMNKRSCDCFHTGTYCSRLPESALLGYGHLGLALRACVLYWPLLRIFSGDRNSCPNRGLHIAIWRCDEQTLRITVESKRGAGALLWERKQDWTAHPGPSSPGRLHNSGTKGERQCMGTIVTSSRILGKDCISGSVPGTIQNISQSLPPFSLCSSCSVNSITPHYSNREGDPGRLSFSRSWT